jgi:tartrate dehydratase beta subunit/fumarate hydratase class I family protein
VPSVHFLEEWGAAEACWEFEMADFPCVVAMDSHSTSLFNAIEKSSSQKLAGIT